MSMYEVPRTYYIGQSTVATCWRACYEVMIRYAVGDPKTAYTLPDHKRMEKSGIKDPHFPVCAKALGLGGIRWHWFKDIENMNHALRCWGPVWVSGFYCDGHKHVVVVKGIDLDEKHILVIDPWRGYVGAKGKAVEWSFSYFRNRINPVPWSCQLWY